MSISVYSADNSTCRQDCKLQELYESKRSAGWSDNFTPNPTHSNPGRPSFSAIPNLAFFTCVNSRATIHDSISWPTGCVTNSPSQRHIPPPPPIMPSAAGTTPHFLRPAPVPICMFSPRPATSPDQCPLAPGIEIQSPVLTRSAWHSQSQGSPHPCRHADRFFKETRLVVACGPLAQGPIESHASFC